MAQAAIPDLEGWEVYCEECGAFREARSAEERDAARGSQYFELVCTKCDAILLTFQRLGTHSEEDKPPEIVAASARCPHCGDREVSVSLRRAQGG